MPTGFHTEEVNDARDNTTFHKRQSMRRRPYTGFLDVRYSLLQTTQCKTYLVKKLCVDVARSTRNNYISIEAWSIGR